MANYQIDGLSPYSSGAIPIKRHHSQHPLISHEFFEHVLTSSSTPTSSSFKNHQRPRLTRFSRSDYALFIVAAIFLFSGVYFSLMGWHSDVDVKKQAVSLTNLANKIDNSTGDIGNASASTKMPVPSTTPISAAAVADYTVAPNLPRYLIIPKLGVNARVLSVGVTSSGALGTPDNVFDTAWYDESAEPGQPGAMLIDGHVSSWTAHGVFYGLKTLAPGDTIKVERGDGTIFTYQVVKTQVYPSGSVNMQAAITPVVAGQPGLNLISCTGDVIPGTSAFNERIIVFATQVSS